MFRVLAQRCRFVHEVTATLKHAVGHQAGVLECMLQNLLRLCALRLLRVTFVFQVLEYIYKHHSFYLFTFPFAGVKVLSDAEEDCINLVQVTHSTFLHHVLYIFHARHNTT